MKLSATILAVALLAAGSALAIDYSAVPKTGKMTKAPVGSTVTIQGTGKFGGEFENIFRVQQDGSLKLVAQYPINTR